MMPTSSLWTPSLRARLAILLVVACLLPQCYTEYVALRQTHAQLTAAKQTQLAARADQIAVEFDAIHQGYRRALERVAHRRDIVTSCADRRPPAGDLRVRILDLLQSFPASDPNVRGAGLIDATGRVVIATERVLEGLDFSGRNSVRAAQAGQPVTSGIYVSSSLTGERASVAYLAPVLDGKRVACIVGIWVNAELFWRELQQANNLAGEGSYAVLLDANGVRIGHSSSPDSLFRPTGRLDVVLTDKLVAEGRFGKRTRELLADVREFPEQFARARDPRPDGAPFRGISPINNAWNHGVGRRLQQIDWTVFYMAPETELENELAAATRARLLFAGGILALTLLAGWLLASRILRSVGVLTRATTAIAAGTPGVQVPPLGNDELGELGRSFNTMATRLQSQAEALRAANDDLEKRVQERTREATETAERLAAEIREHAAADERTLSHQRLLQAILDNSGAVIYAKDTAGRFMLVNNRFCELFGLDQNAAIGKSDRDLFGAEVSRAFEVVDQQVMREGEPLIREELVPQPDGDHTYLSVKCPLRDADGTVQGLVGISTDITDRKRDQARQLAQLERLKQIEQITTAIGERQDLRSIYQVTIGSLEDSMNLDFSCLCTHDAVGQMLRVVHLGQRSHALLDRLTLTENSLIPVDTNGLGKCIRGQLVYEPDIGTSSFPFPRRLARGGLRSVVLAPLSFEGHVFGVLIAARRNPQAFDSGDCEFLRQVSSHVALAAHQTQLYDDLRAAYEDLRHTQESALQQERLSALGQMASGIAHDINNAISPVALYTETLLEREPDLSPRTRNYLEIIARSIEDVAATVSRMREFSRPREPQANLVPLDVSELVGQVIDLTRARWHDMALQQGVAIELATDIAPHLPAVLGIAGEVREALINLVFNAVDAMPGGGTLTLRSRLSDDARQVVVEVADSGLGMDEEVRKRCFEPFFTTKGERGTGLGLAMVYGVMQRADGEVTITSQPGEGTTVRLLFNVPQADTAGAGEAAPALPPAQAPAPTRILVVDDDPTLLRSLCESLRADGHDVTGAAGGEAGIQAFTEVAGTPDEFAVVFTDLGMPRVGGREVAAAIRQLSAQVRIILLTGWGQRLTDNADVPPGVDLVLSKPARIRELRAALAGTGGPTP